MNMGLAIGMLGLTTLAVALLLVPLILRGRGAEARDAYNLAVYRDQLAEIERDVARGIIEPAEAEAAKSEIGRRILALSPGAAAAPSTATPLAIASVAIIMLPFAAWSLYWVLGSPTVPDQPLAARNTAPAGAATAANAAGGTANPHPDMADAVRKLTIQLQQHPDDLNSWVLLARADISLNRYKDAVDAYRHAVDISAQKNPEILGDFAEALVLAAGGKVTPEAEQAFQSVLSDPDNAPRSRYYLALAKQQAGDTKGALQAWVDLEADSPDDADWLPLLRHRIAEAAQAAGIDPATLKTSSGAPRKPVPVAAATPPTATPAASATAAAGGSASPAAAASSAARDGNMPSGEQVAEAAKATAGMSTQDRQAMINGMVERLAQRLQQQPDDIDGWTRLGRAYMVLNQPAKSADAYSHAVKLKPDDLGLKQQYAEAIVEVAGEGELPDQAVDLFRQVLTAEPKNAEALWYVGLAEAAAGHKDTAHDLWTQLLAELPANAPGRQQVEQRLAELKEPAPAK